MKRVQFDSIRLSLIMVVLLGALPILAMILISGRELREQEVQTAKLDAMRLVRSFADQQESVTLGVRQLLSTLSEVSDVQHFEVQACTKLFKALVRQDPHHANITLLLPDGEVIASALPFSKANFSDQLHVAKVIATRRFAAGEYIVGRLSTEPILAFAQPVLDGHGKLIGILTTSLKLNHFVDMFNAAMLPAGSSMGINDGRGIRLLSYPYRPDTNPIGVPISPQAAKAILSPQTEGMAEFMSPDGVRRYFAFKQLFMEPQTPPYLSIVVGIPEAQILGKADHATRRYLLWFAAAASLSLLAALLAGKYGIIDPLRRFASLAKRVGDGDLDAVTGMAGAGGTLGIVATAFDDMIQALKTRATERSLAEQALRASGERFRQVVEGTDNLVTQVDASGRFLYVNPVARRILGKEPEDCIGLSAFDVVHLDDREATQRAFQDWAAQGLLHVIYENRIVSLSGEVRQMSWTIDLHYDSDGKITTIDSIAQDVTGRKLAEKKLSDAKAMLDAAFEQNPFPMALVTVPDGILRIANKACKEFLCIEDEPSYVDLPLLEIPQSWREYDQDGRFVPMSELPLALAMRGVTTRNALYRIARKDGQSRWELVSGCPVYDEDGTIIAAFIIFPDITGRVLTENELARQKMLLHSVIESTTDAIYIKDLQGRYLLANSGVAKATGKPVEEILGRDDTALFPPTEAARIMAFDRLVMEGGTVRNIDDTLTTSTGTRTYLTTKGPLRDEQGQLFGTFGISRDDTDRRRMQEIMIQTEKMMSVGGLAAGMAHEINNPLAAILQSAQVVLSHISSSVPANSRAAAECGCSLENIQAYMEKRGIPKFIEGIRDAGTRAARIVANMLEFSRRAEPKHENADINALLEKTLELAASDYDLKKKYDFKLIRIIRDYALALPPLRCSETEIEQVVLNLLKNAAQAMAPKNSTQGQPSITLRTRKDADIVVIEVEDNGPGMEEAVRKRVFEPFFTTKAPGAGTGLGLSVSYFIITENHQGTIEVASAPGQGTRFILRLPLSPEPSSGDDT